MPIQLELQFETDSESHSGRFSGSGELTLTLNAASATLRVDYQNPDYMIFHLSGSQGVKIGADRSLTFMGGLSYDVLSRDLEGRFALQLKVHRNLAATLTQTFAPDGRGGTALEVTFSF